MANNNDFKLILKDSKGKIIRHVDKDMLEKSCPYFQKFFSFKDCNKLSLEVSDVDVANDLINSFYGFTIPTNDWSYQLHLIKIMDYLGMELKMPMLKISAEDFDKFIAICEIIGFNDKTLKLINKNLPGDYDLSKLSEDLIKAMIDRGINQRIIFHSKFLCISVNYEFFMKFKNSKRDIYTIAVTHDNTHIVTGDNNGIVGIWNIAEYYMERDFRAHEKAVYIIKMSMDDKYIITGFLDKIIKIWDFKTRSLVKTLVGHENIIRCMTLTHDNTRIISGSGDKNIKIWDIKSGEMLGTLNGHEDSVTSVCVTTNDKYIVSASYDLTIKIWNTDEKSLIRSIKDIYSINLMVITPDNKYIVYVGLGINCNGVKINVRDMESGILVKTLLNDEDVKSIVIYEGNFVIVGTCYGNIYIWSLEKGIMCKKIEKPKSSNAITNIAVCLQDTALTLRLKDFLSKNKNEDLVPIVQTNASGEKLKNKIVSKLKKFIQW